MSVMDDSVFCVAIAFALSWCRHALLSFGSVFAVNVVLLLLLLLLCIIIVVVCDYWLL